MKSWNSAFISQLDMWWGWWIAVATAYMISGTDTDQHLRRFTSHQCSEEINQSEALRRHSAATHLVELAGHLCVGALAANALSNPLSKLMACHTVCQGHRRSIVNVLCVCNLCLDVYCIQSWETNPPSVLFCLSPGCMGQRCRLKYWYIKYWCTAYRQGCWCFICCFVGG